MAAMAAGRPTTRLIDAVRGGPDWSPSAFRARQWLPLLTGALRDRTFAVVEEIAVALENAHMPMAGDDRPSAGGEWSLASGASGIALFFAYAAKAGLRANARARSGQLLDRAVAAMASAILDLVDDPDGRERTVEAATAVVESLAWDRVKGDYVGLIDSLAGGSTTGSDARTGGA